MPSFPSSFVRCAHTSTNATRQAARKALGSKRSTLSIPSVLRCPTPTCDCAEMPPGLDIDHKTNLHGAMPVYNQHILVSTGQSNWKSRIEDEAGAQPWGSLVSNLKRMLGPKGGYYSPSSNTIINTCSFSAANAVVSEQQLPKTSSLAQVLLFPSFQLIDNVGTEPEDVHQLLQSHLISTEAVQSLHRDARIEEKARTRHDLKPISAPTILICSHYSRDARCGILGPLLHTEFTSYINKSHTLRVMPFSEDLTAESESSTPTTFAATNTFEPDLLARVQPDRRPSPGLPINVGMISHIGGHKWAGNVIVYIPRDWHCAPVDHGRAGDLPQEALGNDYKSLSDGDALHSFVQDPNPLAGKGIWYGRVEPKHVEGIVEQTIGRGVIIEELFRGGINQDGTPLRL